MAIEAISQINNLEEHSENYPSFVFRNVNIQSALVVSHEDNESELFTTMYKEKISTASTSDKWYEFSISSFTAENAVQHCVGTISLESSSQNPSGQVHVNADGYDKWEMSRWYQKLEDQGLCYGPAFHVLTSMKTDKAKEKPEALSTTNLLQRIPMSRSSKHPGTFYPVHPVVIDACLQASIMGGTAGNIETLKAYLPVFINHCRVSRPSANQVGMEAFIHTQSQSTGFATKKISATVRDNSEKVVVDLANARLTLYNGKTEKVHSADSERHPFLRVIWKPDVARIDGSSQQHLRKYLQTFLDSRPGLADSQSVGVAAGLIDLVGHKNPRLRALELGRDCDCKSRKWLDVIDTNTSFARYREYHVGSFTEDGELSVANIKKPEEVDVLTPDSETFNAYDLIILSDASVYQMSNRNCWLILSRKQRRMNTGTMRRSR